MPVSKKIPRFVGRLWSGLRINASFQIFALAARWNVLGVERNCPGENSPGSNVQGKVVVLQIYSVYYVPNIIEIGQRL